MEKDNIGNWYMFSSRRNVKILWSEEKIELVIKGLDTRW